MIPKTKENTLYLPIKQVYFDQILKGTKKEEYREVKEGVTASRYLQKRGKEFVKNKLVTSPMREYYIDDYNDGHFPFLPKDIKYLDIAVGYAKDRDTATVEVTGISFEPAKVFNNKIAWWIIVFHLGRVVTSYRKLR